MRVLFPVRCTSTVPRSILAPHSTGVPVSVSANHVHFFIAYLVSFVVFGLIAKWYLLPALRRHPLPTALTPLLLYACLRVNGLTFLMPGVVGSELPRAFALPTAYGDLASVVLALLALAALRTGSRGAVPLVWLFNVVGLLDLAYANVATFLYQVDPASLGASFYLVVLNVPAMIVVHGSIIVLLLERPATA